MKVSELTGAKLDYWVAKADGLNLKIEQCGPAPSFEERWRMINAAPHAPLETKYSPSSNWLDGGPIIERERIATKPSGDVEWIAKIYKMAGDPLLYAFGETPLIAAMRAYVVSKFGEEVEDDR